MIIFINEKYLKDKTNLTNNIDISILIPSIIKAQDIYISPFLGFELDEELKNAIDNGTTSLMQQSLLSIIRKSQAEYTAYESYMDVLVRMTNKTGAIGNLENGNAIDIPSIYKLRSLAKGHGDFYLREAKKFLNKNILSFPNWKNKILVNKNIVFDSPYENGNPYWNENYYGNNGFRRTGGFCCD